jgi:hypothetical protein
MYNLLYFKCVYNCIFLYFNYLTTLMGWQGINFRVTAYNTKKKKSKVLFYFEADPDDTTWRDTSWSINYVREDLIKNGYNLIKVHYCNRTSVDSCIYSELYEKNARLLYCENDEEIINMLNKTEDQAKENEKVKTETENEKIKDEDDDDNDDEDDDDDKEEVKDDYYDYIYDDINDIFTANFSYEEFDDNKYDYLYELNNLENLYFSVESSREYNERNGYD